MSEVTKKEPRQSVTPSNKDSKEQTAKKLLEQMERNKASRKVKQRGEEHSNKG